MSVILSGLSILFKIIGSGLYNFVDFISNLPSLFYHLIDFVPMPFQNLLIVFLSIIVFIIVMKVVSHFV